MRKTSLLSIKPRENKCSTFLFIPFKFSIINISGASVSFWPVWIIYNILIPRQMQVSDDNLLCVILSIKCYLSKR